jgi:hypothetical protein
VAELDLDTLCAVAQRYPEARLVVLFDPAPAAEAVLGPLTAYRCFQFGTLCGGADPGRSPGPRDACAPGSFDPDPAHQLVPPEDLGLFVRSLKPQDPRLVYVSVIAGAAGPIVVGLDGDGFPALEPLCSPDVGPVGPAPRLAAFVAAFDADRARLLPLCAQDLGAALGAVAGDLAALLGP